MMAKYRCVKDADTVSKGLYEIQRKATVLGWRYVSGTIAVSPERAWEKLEELLNIPLPGPATVIEEREY